jgi:hypothetical protein
VPTGGEIKLQPHWPTLVDAIERLTHLHRQSFLAQIQNHPAAYAIKTGKRRRMHHLPQTSPPLRKKFLILFHTWFEDEFRSL